MLASPESGALARFSLVILTVFVFMPSRAFGGWIPDGVPVCTGCYPYIPQVASDAQGGAYVTWSEGKNRLYDLYGTRVGADGSEAPGWPLSGIPICVAPGDPIGPRVVCDGLGGMLVVWNDARDVNAGSGDDIYVQRIQADGTLAPGWPVNGAAAVKGPGFQTDPSIVADGGGGAFVAWWEYDAIDSLYVFAQHMAPDGTVAPGWPVGGVLVCNKPCTFPAIVPDGRGGVVVAWRDFRRGGIAPNGFDIYAVRLTASGALASGWPLNGLLLGAGQWTPELFPDRTGGFFMVSASPSASGDDANYYVQRFQLDGTPAVGWPSGGVLVCAAPGGRENLQSALDGTGGVIMNWYDYRTPGSDVYASRVLATGTLAPGWPADGLRVSDPLNPYEFSVAIAPDGVGGAYLTWETSPYLGGNPSFIQHLTAGAEVAPGWPQYGLGIASTCAQYYPRLVSDDVGGAIAVWEEDDGTCGRVGLFAQHYDMGGVVATQLSLVSADAAPDHVTLLWSSPAAASLTATVYHRTATTAWQALGAPTLDGTDRLRYEDRDVIPGTRFGYRLSVTRAGLQSYTPESWVDVPLAAMLALEGARPNPAVGRFNAAFSLASEAPASLAVLDLAGRQLMQREVGSLGAGRHVVPLEFGSQTPPGVYWLRLSQGGRSLLARAVVIR